MILGAMLRSVLNSQPYFSWMLSHQQWFQTNGEIRAYHWERDALGRQNCKYWWEMAGQRMKTQDWSPDGGQRGDTHWGCQWKLNIYVGASRRKREMGKRREKG